MSVEPPVCLNDLCVATDLDLKTVKKYILEGQLPGQRLGEGRNARWVVTYGSLVAWYEGRWQPRQKPEPLFPDGPPESVQMLRRRAS